MRKNVKAFPDKQLTVEAWVKCEDRDPKYVWKSNSKSGLLGWWDASDFMVGNDEEETSTSDHANRGRRRMIKTDWGNIKEWKDRSSNFNNKKSVSFYADVTNIEKSAVISNHIITGLPILKFIRKAGTNIKFSTNEQNHVLATKNFGILMVLKVDVKGGTFDENDVKYCELFKMIDIYGWCH